MVFLTRSVSRSTAKRFNVLARLLAGAVLVFSLLAADSSIHLALHQNGAAASTTCVFCLLAKGQVESPELAPAITGPIIFAVVLAPFVEFSAPADVHYLSSPSRAPPAPLSLLSVLA